MAAARNTRNENGLHQLSRAMGALEERVSNLVKAVDLEIAEAKTHREGLRNVIAALTEAVRTLNTQVTDIIPEVRDYRESRAERRGATKLGKLVWVTGLGGATGVGAAIAWALQHLSFH